ncbi:isocitrate lyase/PEP mutase family protein [Nonomuraea jabiensis]|uniref:isocitrate lyase/PEP mutase family protein n=1 Tax=Nonomuraea jabiensis TaxID=882448 RepID=UPI003D75DB30
MSTRTEQQAKAQRFADLHASAPLILPNAWDAGSARLIAGAGATAIATTSGGHSWSLGLPDGGHLSREQAIELVARVVATVDVPVSADIETGYGDSLTELSATVEAVLQAGAVGLNIEDSGQDPLYDIEAMAERIAAVRQSADRYGVPLFINARTDVVLFGSGTLEEIMARAKAYAQAGADGIFVPGLLDLDALRTLAAATSLPVNVMIVPGAPSVAELVAAGVTRISAGTALTQSVYAHTQRAAREMLTDGTYTALAETIGYGDLNTEFSVSR